jgi:5-(carboxyamino)imidazole ribonucleotide mutase
MPPARLRPEAGEYVNPATYDGITTMGKGMALVGIIMGSDSDLPVMSQAAQVCADFHVPHEVAIVSAHRTPHRMVTYAETAHQRGLRVIIAGAGGAAHLPGMVAALTPLPVIGVPVPTAHLQGLDSLYSIVQMPKGIPVATVAIGNATNAGLLAVQILALGDAELFRRLQTYRQHLTQQVCDKQERLAQQGWHAYLNP